MPVTTADQHTASGFLQLQSASGLTLVANFGTLAVHMIQPSDGDAALPPPLPQFTQLYVSSASTAVVNALASATLAADKIDARGRSVAPVLSRLAPSSDVAVRVYLTNEEGRLVGSGEVPHAAIRPGLNNLDLAIAAVALPPFLIGASDSVNVSDNVIVKGATLAVSTGLPKDAPGVARVEVEVSGPAYNGGSSSAQIASLTPPGLDQFQWRPVNPSGEYDPSKLVATNDKTPFNLVMRAYDPFDHAVGEAKLALSVIGTASVDVGVDAP